MIDPGDIRHPRGDPGGEDNLIKCPQIVGRHPGFKPQRDAGKIQHPAVITQSFMELLFAGDLFGDSKLAANLMVPVKERHLMPARGGVNGKGQAGRTGADYPQPLRCGRGRYRHQGFMAGARVDQTRGDFTGEDPIEAGLVAANTDIDLIRPPALCFREKFAVGEERAGHRYHVGVSAGQDRLRHGGIVNPVGGDQRDRHRAFQLAGDPAKRAARYRSGDGGNARLVPADAGIDNRGPGGLNRFRQRGDLRQGAAAADQVEHRQAVDNNKIAARALPHGSDHLYGKTHASGVVAAPQVVAQVGARGKKFVNQIAFRAHHFDAVVPGFPRQLGAAGKIIDQL